MNENGNLYLTGGNDRRIKLSDSGIAGESDSNNTVHVRGEDDSLKLNAAGNGHTIFEENGILSYISKESDFRNATLCYRLNDYKIAHLPI